MRHSIEKLRAEWFLVVVYGTALLFFAVGGSLTTLFAHPIGLTLVLSWLFAVILGSSLRVVHHAERLAVLLGEPYGTLILTLSVTFIEVISIVAVMTHGAQNPTLARDTMFAVVMIILNGMVGLSLLLGGWRHREQHYNLQGANAYLGTIIPLVVLALILPSFTQTTPGPIFSGAQRLFLAIVSICLYVTFLAMQTGRHRGFFIVEDGALLRAADHDPPRSTAFHALLLIAYLAPVVYLADHLAVPFDYLIETLGVPNAFGGVLIAVLVATPEALGAIRAAANDNVQRSINIFLGSVLSTIGLTVPAMMLVSLLTGHQLILGVEHTDSVLIVLTLAVCVVTFANGRTNVIQGAVHMILFATYLLFTIQG